MKTSRDKELEFTKYWVPVQTVVKGYIRSLVRDIQHTEDLLQEVALRAHNRFDEYDRTRPFVGWVLGIARYQVLAYYKTVKADRHVFNDVLLDVIEQQFVELHPSIGDRDEALRRCMGKLPKEMSEMMSVRYAEGLSAPQIAERTGLTPTAVNTKLYRIRKALKQCVEDRLRATGAAHG